MNSIFVLFVQAHPTKKKKDGVKISWMQSKVVKTIVDNMIDGKFPKQPDGKYIILVEEGTEERCKEMEKEFWETGTVGLQDKINKNIDESRITPRWLKKKFKKLIGQSDKVRDYFMAVQTCFSVTTSTHVLPYMDLIELEAYFDFIETLEA